MPRPKFPIVHLASNEPRDPSLMSQTVEQRDGMRGLVIRGSELNFPERASPRAACRPEAIPKIFLLKGWLTSHEER